ncbi:MAG: sigma 54-interacting transcriptional regulator [Planctomycetes bacterium]|nr:sigma 54-interacting transcriptional regulator [Planctomycetota bacterium]MBI3843712.1 sigma 54-interacting transcriptional regulator [Planctomycetota bacterium]
MPGTDSSSKRHADPPVENLEPLLHVVEGTATAVGQALFDKLVAHLARALGTSYALVAESVGGGRARTLAFWREGRLAPPVEWALAGTPFEGVSNGDLCHPASGVGPRFPNAALEVTQVVDGFFGVALRGPNGQHLGHLCVFDSKPLPLDPRQLALFKIFAARAAAELARIHVERELGESEERFRDLFDEAPIAYVHEDLESRFIRANRAAMRILGLKPEEVVGNVGISMVPDTPDAQRRVREAFESIGRGTDTSGVVLELRRKDNGKPVWIQWWSKPDPSGTYTRTMFVDITDRVQMEQDKARLEAQNTYLREEIQSVHNFAEIVGKSPALLSVLESAHRVAATDSSVLITGETGTGKELVARAIHSASKRHDRPLIKLNCAALPTGLVESELFGHEKGAFSGAIARRIGRFELAHGGTIFLDEIGEVPPDVQVKLLRVLQEREFERVGGNTPIKVDVRVIAATNRDLLSAMREGTFREDLYYRLNVFPIQQSPLRDRKEDIPLLVHFFLKKFSIRIGKRVDGIADSVMERFMAYRWPGNIRELENMIERAVILASGDVLDMDSIPSLSEAASVVAPPRSSPTPTHAATTRASLEDVERAHILAMLEKTNWVIDGPSGAAKKLALNPSTLRSRMQKLGISRAPRPAP